MIVCCGEALIDFLPRKTADGAVAYQPFCGGSVYNTAIALGRLGVPTGLFTGLSTDFFGDMLRDGLNASKVSLAYRQGTGTGPRRWPSSSSPRAMPATPSSTTIPPAAC